MTKDKLINLIENSNYVYAFYDNPIADDDKIEFIKIIDAKDVNHANAEAKKIAVETKTFYCLVRD